MCTKTADCYVQKVCKSTAGMVDVELRPLGPDFSTGEWSKNALNPTNTFVWHVDIEKFGLFEFIEFYVSFKMWKMEHVQNSQCHYYFSFDLTDQVVGIV